MTGEQFRDADRDLAEDALRELVAEIAIGDYRDSHRQRLVMNTAYLKAVALLALADATGTAGLPKS